MLCSRRYAPHRQIGLRTAHATDGPSDADWHRQQRSYCLAPRLEKGLQHIGDIADQANDAIHHAVIDQPVADGAIFIGQADAHGGDHDAVGQFQRADALGAGERGEIAAHGVGFLSKGPVFRLK